MRYYLKEDACYIYNTLMKNCSGYEGSKAWQCSEDTEAHTSLQVQVQVKRENRVAVRKVCQVCGLGSATSLLGQMKGLIK